MPDEVHALELEAVEELLHGIDEEVDVAGAHVLRRAAVAGKLERVDGVALGQRRAAKSQLLRSPPKPCSSSTASPPSPWRR